MKRLALAGPAILVVLLCARVEWGSARSPVSAHAHVFLAQELVLLLGAALLAGLASWSKLRVPRDAVSLSVFALVALEIAAAASASDPWLALRSATVWISGLAVLLVAREIRGRDRELALAATLFPLGLAAGSVVVEALGFVRLSAPHHAPGGLLGERNVAAELLVAGAPLVAYLALAAGPMWRRAALVVAGVSVAAVVLARTRSAWLAGLVLLAPLVALLFRRGAGATTGRARRVAVAVALGVVVALVLPTATKWKSAEPYRDSLVHLVDASTPSGRGRLVQYATTVRMALGHPGFGVGPGNWAGRYLSFARPGDPTVHEGLSPVNRLPNSDVLGFAAERGLLAFGVLLVLGVLLVRNEGLSPGLRALRRATLLSVMILSGLDAVLQTPAALFLVAWVVGLSSGAGDSELVVPRSSRAPFAIACAALLILVLPSTCRVVSTKLAAHARGSDDLEHAVWFDPGDVGLRLVAAESWIADGRCDRAGAHLVAVAKFSPASPALAELEERCSSFASRRGLRSGDAQDHESGDRTVCRMRCPPGTALATSSPRSQ